MKLLNKIIVPIFISLLLYGFLFLFLKKPLTLGRINDHYKAKLAYSELVGSERKIVILGGSTGMFSLSCEVIEKRTGLKCVNASMTVGLGIDFILEKGREFINPGDIVIMPLEYSLYSHTKGEVIYAKQGNNYIYQYEKDYITRFSTKKAEAAFFSFDFK